MGRIPLIFTVSGAKGAYRLFRLDPATGEVIGYLMPVKDFDVKQVSISLLDRQTVWMANTRNARLIKLEVLD